VASVPPLRKKRRLDILKNIVFYGLKSLQGDDFMKTRCFWVYVLIVPIIFISSCDKKNEQQNKNLEEQILSNTTAELTNLHPDIAEFQDEIRARYATENKQVKKGQILFVGSSLMEIFPIEQIQKKP
jgi:hypothetical protein